MPPVRMSSRKGRLSTFINSEAKSRPSPDIQPGLTAMRYWYASMQSSHLASPNGKQLRPVQSIGQWCVHCQHCRVATFHEATPGRILYLPINETPWEPRPTVRTSGFYDTLSE
jgi:hypothetical protein